MAVGYWRRRVASSGPMSPLVWPYIAPSRPSLAFSRSPWKACAASAAYRSPSAAVRASPASWERAASTRGSSWAASATTRAQPGSATTAPRRMRGICSAPPPRLAQRPETTPPTTYSGRNRPPRAQASCQAQPWAACSRDSSLYRTIRRAAGWSILLSSQERVEASWMPWSAKARSTWVCESGLNEREPSACCRSAAMSASSFGWAPGRCGRGPSRSVSSWSWMSARQGSPS